MATICGPKYTGTLLIDLSPLKEVLNDLPPGALKGARTEQEGIAGVLEELADAIPNHGDEAEIHPAIYKRVLDRTVVIAQLREAESKLEKLLEVCRESRGENENNREDDLSAIGTKAEEKAEKGKNSGLLAHFEKTIHYKAQGAEKALETRRKNEEAAKKAAAAAATAAATTAAATAAATGQACVGQKLPPGT